MSKQFGACALTLALTVCSSAPAPAQQPATDMAQAEINIATWESAANASCPLIALQIHQQAAIARQAIATNNGPLLTMATAAIPSLTALCKTEKDDPQRYAFNTATLDQFRHSGPSSLTGQAFMRQRGGGIVTCAGQSVTLMVATAYVDAVAPVLDSGGSLPRDVLDHIAQSIVRKSTCDAQGRFVFMRIMPGEYYVGTTVAWMVGNEPQGGPIEKRIKVSPGDNDVILSQ